MLLPCWRSCVDSRTRGKISSRFNPNATNRYNRNNGTNISAAPNMSARHEDEDSGDDSDIKRGAQVRANISGTFIYVARLLVCAWLHFAAAL